MTTLRAGVALCIVLAGVPGCRDREPVVIGYAFGAGNAGTVQTARAALAQDSAARPVRIVYDSVNVSVAADAEVARAESLLVVPGLAGVVGHYGSRGSLVTAPLYNRRGVPQIVPTGTSRLLATIGEWTLPMAPNEELEGEFIAGFTADSLRARRASVFYLNNEYGRGIREVVTAGLRRRGVAVVDEVPFDRASRFPVLVEASLERGRPDVLIVAAEPTEGMTILRLASQRARGLRYILADGAFNPAIVDTAVPLGRDSVYGVTFWQADSAEAEDRAFVALYSRVTGRVPGHLQAMSFDALMVLAAAAREVGPTPAAIRRYLLELGRTRPAYPGVTGPVTFQPDRRAALYVVRVRDRAIVARAGT